MPHFAIEVLIDQIQNCQICSAKNGSKRAKCKFEIKVDILNKKLTGGRIWSNIDRYCRLIE